MPVEGNHRLHPLTSSTSSCHRGARYLPEGVVSTVPLAELAFAEINDNLAIKAI